MEDEPGDRQAAGRNSGREVRQPQEGTRRTCHEKLHSFKTEPGQDPELFAFVVDHCLDLPEDMGQLVPNKGYGDIFQQGLPAEYQRLNHQPRAARFGLEDVRYMPTAKCGDKLSSPSHSNSVAGRGIATSATN